jgi:Tol biopolymer transport system component
VFQPPQFEINYDPWTVSAGKPGTAKRLVRFRERAYDFVYSPNGRMIAFTAELPALEIVVMKANGTKPRVVTRKIRKCIGKRRPTWSPNGKKIAFTCTNSKGFNHQDVWSVNLNGKGVRQVSRTHDAYFPVWSPRGNKIAYTTYGGIIYTVPARGGKSRMISEDAPGGFLGGTWNRIDWSPDGKTLVADSSGDGIYTLDAATGVTSNKLAHIGIEPVFSPNGKKILYVNIEKASGGKVDLWMMDVNGANKKRITRNGYNRTPNWGPAR